MDYLYICTTRFKLRSLFHRCFPACRRFVLAAVFCLAYGTAPAQQCEHCGIGTDVPRAKLEIKGCGIDETTASLLVVNNIGDTLLFVRDDQRVKVKGPLTIGAYTLPNTDGSNEEILKTDGSGNVSWKSECCPDPKPEDPDRPVVYLDTSGVLATAVNVVIDEDDNVGIGTANPSDKVEIVGGGITGETFTFDLDAGEASKRITSEQVGDASSFELQTYNSDSSRLSTRLLLQGRFNHEIRFYGSDENRIATFGNKGNFRIGSSSPSGTHKLEVEGDAAKEGGGSWSTLSDSRLKASVTPFTDGLNTIRAIDPVRFRYKSMAWLRPDKAYIGVSAQDVQQVAPYCVSTGSIPIRESDLRAFSGDVMEMDSPAANGEKQYEAEVLYFNRDGLFYALINAAKELDAENQALRQELQDIKGRLEALETE